MSKTFITKRNRSQETWNPFSTTPSSRRKSLPRATSDSRERSPGRVGYKSEFPLQESIVHGLGNARHVSPSSPSSRRTRPTLRHQDLKRKLVFDLHHEVQKPIHTITLEEISDMERITSICMTTLKAMMENKVHRKFLHHMTNNNNHNNNTLNSLAPDSITLNTSTNSASRQGSLKKGSVPFTPFDFPEKPKTSLRTSQSIPDPQKNRKTSEPKRPVPTPTKTRRDSGAPGNFGFAAALPTIQDNDRGRRKSAPMIGKHGNLPDIDTFRNKNSDPKQNDAATIASMTTTHATSKSVHPGNKKALTPMEALHCPWLRLSRAQVDTLEQLVREEGKDPGIHAHADTSKYDVFSEIREIRKQEKATMGTLSERDEMESMIDSMNDDFKAGKRQSA